MSTRWLHRICESGSTVGATTATLCTFTVPVSTTIGYTVRVVGYEATTPASAFFFFTGSAFRAAGTAALIASFPGTTPVLSAALAAALATLVRSTNDVSVQVTGVALLTISWAVDVEPFVYTP